MNTPANIPAVEREAWTAIQASDWRGALTSLMDAYGDRLYGFCLKMLRDPEVTKDVHQVVFVQAWEALKGFKGGSSLKTWLYGIARHRCLDELKSQRRRNARFELTDDPPDRNGGVGDVQRRLENRSIGTALEECLGGLSQKVREAVLLRCREGFSYPEMAQISREQPATLQARVARALPKLRRCLEGKGVSL